MDWIWNHQLYSSTKPRKVVCQGLIDVNNGIYIQHDSIVQVKCKCGSVETVEFYFVLTLITKYYNK
eukprot:9878747-Ditylum_brightwellii.AAC.1